jgi:hypothetical protein
MLYSAGRVEDQSDRASTSLLGLWMKYLHDNGCRHTELVSGDDVTTLPPGYSVPEGMTLTYTALTASEQWRQCSPKDVFFNEFHSARRQWAPAESGGDDLTDRLLEDGHTVLGYTAMKAVGAALREGYAEGKRSPVSGVRAWQKLQKVGLWGPSGAVVLGTGGDGSEVPLLQRVGNDPAALPQTEAPSIGRCGG